MGKKRKYDLYDPHREFKPGDWCIYPFDIHQIAEVHETTLVFETDPFSVFGLLRQASKNTCYSLTYRRHSITRVFDRYWQSIVKLGHPDKIRNHIVALWEDCMVNYNDHDLATESYEKIYDILKQIEEKVKLELP